MRLFEKREAYAAEYKKYIAISSDGVVTKKLGAGSKKKIPVKVKVKAFDGYKKTLLCKVTVK
jgi:hypothetical protein